jgi:hypothetical protein
MPIELYMNNNRHINTDYIIITIFINLAMAQITNGGRTFHRVHRTDRIGVAILP